MGNCRKCGGYRVVATDKGYFGKAFVFTVFFSIFFAASLPAMKDKVSTAIIVVVFILIAIYLISLWGKAFSGNRYTSYECKECGEKWNDS